MIEKRSFPFEARLERSNLYMHIFGSCVLIFEKEREREKK